MPHQQRPKIVFTRTAIAVISLAQIGSRTDSRGTGAGTGFQAANPGSGAAIEDILAGFCIEKESGAGIARTHAVIGTPTT